METNDPNTQDLDELRIVVGVDGSACSHRAVEFAAKEASRWGALLHVVSVYHELPTEGGLVVPLCLFQESAEAIVSDAASSGRSARAHRRRQVRDRARRPRTGADSTEQGGNGTRGRHAWP